MKNYDNNYKNNYKKDFPYFTAHPEVSYLDNAATTHKPASVIQRLSDFYAYEYASAHRSMYAAAETATELYEKTREHTAQFINAPCAASIVFTKNATDSIQIVSQNWAAHTLKAGDEIILSELEHHSNIVPWQQYSKRGVILRWVPISPSGLIDHEALSRMITHKTKLLALTASSNVLGDIRGLLGESLTEDQKANFLKNSIQQAHAYGASVLLDVSQLVAHERINVTALDCDFAVFSAHKMLGPQGVGVLYVKPQHHAAFIASSGGGGSVITVDHHAASWQPFPFNLEAGTQAVAQVVAFDAALTYFKENIDFAQLKLYQNKLYAQLLEEIKKLPYIRILGPAGTASSSKLSDKLPDYTHHSISFVVDSVHPHDCAAYLESRAILVRAGHHCASLLHKALNAPQGSVRISSYLYTTPEDIQKTVQALIDLPDYFRLTPTHT